jgi:hypothetical protein
MPIWICEGCEPGCKLEGMDLGVLGEEFPQRCPFDEYYDDVLYGWRQVEEAA